jgi:hypothetical protein
MSRGWYPRGLIPTNESANADVTAERVMTSVAEGDSNPADTYLVFTTIYRRDRFSSGIRTRVMVTITSSPLPTNSYAVGSGHKMDTTKTERANLGTGRNCYRWREVLAGPFSMATQALKRASSDV